MKNISLDPRADHQAGLSLGAQRNGEQPSSPAPLPLGGVCQFRAGTATAQPDPPAGLWHRGLPAHLCPRGGWASWGGKARAGPTRDWEAVTFLQAA